MELSLSLSGSPNDEDELLQEALALLDECHDDDVASYDAALSRLLLPFDDEHGVSNCTVGPNANASVNVNGSANGSAHGSPSTSDSARSAIHASAAKNNSPNGNTPPADTTMEDMSLQGLGSSGDWGVASLFAPIAASAVAPSTSPYPSTPRQRKKKTGAAAAKAKAGAANGKKRKTATHNSNRARDERKEELIYLRKTVQTMEARLRAMKLSQRGAAQRRALAAGSVPGETAALTTGAIALATVQAHGMDDTVASRTEEEKAEDAALGPVWTEIAARQYQERRRAELENIRLKLILEGQVKMAKSLEKMLTKRTSLRVMESVQGKYLTSLQHRRPMPPDEEDEAAIFVRLQRELEGALDEVDAVMEANGLARMEKAYGDAQVRHDAQGNTIMEIFANKVLPFSVEATGRAVWQHFAHAMDHIPSRFVYEKQLKNADTTADMLVESFGLELVGSRNATGAFRVRQIRRKFELADRVVIAWRVYSEALELSAEPTKGVRLHEKGFTVVRPVPSTSGRRGSLIQTCYLLRPDIYGQLDERERILTTLTDFLLDSVPNTINSSHQMIENYLLDGALRHAPAASTQAMSETPGLCLGNAHASAL